MLDLANTRHKCFSFRRGAAEEVSDRCIYMTTTHSLLSAGTQETKMNF